MKKFLITLVVIFGWTVCALAQMSEAEVNIKFSQGVDAYKNARYPEAIQSFEDILNGKRESGPVYFNLANSYFKQGQTGKAILNYERALRLMPRDSDLQFNHRYVINKIKQLEDVQPASFIDKMIQAFIHFYTTGEMVGIIFGLTLLTGLAFILRLYVQSMRQMTGIFLMVLGVLCVVYATGLFLKIENQKQSAIVLTDIQAKFEPRTEATIHFALFEGSNVKIVGSEGDWFKVKRFDGKLGWVEKKTIGPI